MTRHSSSFVMRLCEIDVRTAKSLDGRFRSLQREANFEL